MQRERAKSSNSLYYNWLLIMHQCTQVMDKEINYVVSFSTGKLTVS